MSIESALQEGVYRFMREPEPSLTSATLKQSKCMQGMVKE